MNYYIIQRLKHIKQVDERSVFPVTKELNELHLFSRQVHDWLHMTHDEYKTLKGMEKNERPNVKNN